KPEEIQEEARLEGDLGALNRAIARDQPILENLENELQELEKQRESRKEAKAKVKEEHDRVSKRVAGLREQRKKKRSEWENLRLRLFVGYPELAGLRGEREVPRARALLDLATADGRVF